MQFRNNTLPGFVARCPAYQFKFTLIIHEALYCTRRITAEPPFGRLSVPLDHNNERYTNLFEPILR